MSSSGMVRKKSATSLREIPKSVIRSERSSTVIGLVKMGASLNNGDSGPLRGAKCMRYIAFKSVTGLVQDR